MSNDKMSKEELKKLEDEAYYELCQIIAEAIETQDIGLLDTRIAAWKSKYKKLLDGSNPNFKKRIEYLLNYYYSEVTQYILSQIRIKEKKVIENQAKAIRKLYLLIKNTNDLATLKKEVEKWKQKYPVDSFLKMYQKRIESYTKVKNLEENAFDQEQAFNDLVEVSKSNEYLDDLKQKLQDWEEKYSINDKYSIDDFLKHQSEVKRFTSEDFLISIAKPEEDILDGIYHGNVSEVKSHQSISDSSLSIQATAYNKLISICKDPNNIDEVFNWVYKNRDVKFNDKYKELILAATYLNYSPTYLNRLSAPNIDLSVESLSFVNYEQISQIKKYAIISYFNLLLPPDKTVTNTYFNNHILKLYNNSKKIEDTVSFNNAILSDDILLLGTEIELNTKTLKKAEPLTTDILIDVSEDTSIIIDLPTKPQDIEKKSTEESLNCKSIEITDVSEVLEEINTKSTKSEDSSKKTSSPKISVESPKDDNISEEQPAKVVEEISLDVDIIAESEKISDDSVSDNLENSNSELEHETITAIAPQFFQLVNNYCTQHTLINIIDDRVNNYIEKSSEHIEEDKTLESITPEPEIRTNSN